MTVKENSPHKFSHGDTTYYFCSQRCHDRFVKDPESFVSSAPDQKGLKTYLPLILIAFYLLGGTVLYETFQSQWNISRMMSNFMGGFFVVFSFFKFLDLPGFASAFRSYDLVAKAVPAYGYVYPFIELALGLAYFLHFQPVWTNIATVVVMGVSTIGVVQSLTRHSRIQCACLGTVIQLPLSTVAVVENGLMFLMALASLIVPH